MKRILGFLFVALFCCGVVSAAACGTATLAVYTVTGFTCTSADGSLTYGNFFYTPASGAPTAGQITVDGNNPTGLSFTWVAPWAVGPGPAGTSIDSNISFTVTATGSIIDDIAANLTSAACTSGGEVLLNETVHAGASTTGTQIGAIQATCTNSGSSVGSEVVTTGAITFTPTSQVTLVKDLELLTGSGANGAASISSFVNSVSTSTPEPGTLMLLGSGLIGIAASIRRRFSK